VTKEGKERAGRGLAGLTLLRWAEIPLPTEMDKCLKHKQVQFVPPIVFFPVNFTRGRSRYRWWLDPHSDSFLLHELMRPTLNQIGGVRWGRRGGGRGEISGEASGNARWWINVTVAAAGVNVRVVRVSPASFVHSV
jgi:hypothetical protein